jgi:phosphocarrier protein HPr
MQENQAYQEREVTISNVQGLHARPVMRFVDIASQFKSSIRVKKDDIDADGKSPMEMMILGAICGTKLRLCADGADAAEALDALAKLINDKFNED